MMKEYHTHVVSITCIDTDVCVADAPTFKFSNCHEIFRNTFGQSKSVIWKQERQCRLTPSRFGLIVKRKTDHADAFVKTFVILQIFIKSLA